MLPLWPGLRERWLRARAARTLEDLPPHLLKDLGYPAVDAFVRADASDIGRKPAAAHFPSCIYPAFRR